MSKVGIFIPIYFREDLVKKSLTDLLKTNFGRLEVFLCLGVNGCSKKFRKELDMYKKYYEKRFTFIKIFDEPKNIGKAKIINKMTEECSNFDYMVSMDSDMQVIDSAWLTKFLTVFNMCHTIMRGQLGALCANQIGENVHLTEVEGIGRASRKISKDYTIVTAKNNNGVAGGVLVTSRDIWRRVGGYKADSIFGSDDGDFMKSCHAIKKIVAYVEEIKFYHPISDDDNYHDWKVRACDGELKDDESQGYFESLRE